MSATDPTPSPAPSGDVRIPVTQEEVDIGRQQVETGQAVRVRKEVDEVPVQLREPLATEGVEIARVPIGRVVDAPPAVRTEGDVTVVPVVEERLVTVRQLVLVEEVRLVRRRTVRTFEAQAQVRRERVVVERLDPQTGQWRPEPDQ